MRFKEQRKHTKKQKKQERDDYKRKVKEFQQYLADSVRYREDRQNERH